MKDVQIEKTKLLQKLIGNREGHRAVYEQAMTVYEKRMSELLENLLARARAGKVVPQTALYDLPMPEDHTNDYDTAIEMLQNEERDHLVLTQQEFRRYWRDQWEWEQSFTSNTRSYTQQG